MGRTIIAPGHGKKRKVSISPDPDILAWVLEQTGPGKRWASLTHAAESAWAKLRDEEEGGKKSKERR